jgi:serine/threonine-protein kinase HipA
MEEIRKAEICVNGIPAGLLEELEKKRRFRFTYLAQYQGPPISLTMPVATRSFTFETFPPFFDGLLPEGIQLEGLLRQAKLDRQDYFGQLLAVGADTVGAITVRESP